MKRPTLKFRIQLNSNGMYSVQKMCKFWFIRWWEYIYVSGNSIKDGRCNFNNLSNAKKEVKDATKALNHIYNQSLELSKKRKKLKESSKYIYV